MFGLTTEQVLGSRGWYSPQWHYENEPETKAALDLIFGGHFGDGFEPIRESLLTRGDYYMHLADLTEYVKSQESAASAYGNKPVWAKRAIHNVARSGKFSSDRTIAEYAKDIWNAKPCPVS